MATILNCENDCRINTCTRAAANYNPGFCGAEAVWKQSLRGSSVICALWFLFHRCILTLRANMWFSSECHICARFCVVIHPPPQTHVRGDCGGLESMKTHTTGASDKENTTSQIITSVILFCCSMSFKECSYVISPTSPDVA